MHLYPDKCKVLQVTTRRAPLQSKYTIHGQVINNVNYAKYLGLNIHKTLSWDVHINKVTQLKAHNTLSFSSRNISRCTTNIKAQCFFTLVRSSLEYAFTESPAKNYLASARSRQSNAELLVSPLVITDEQQCYGDHETIGNWMPLEVRRNNARLVMMYRIVYNLADIPPTTYIQQS
jgi:hypothetical protein